MRWYARTICSEMHDGIDLFFAQKCGNRTRIRNAPMDKTILFLAGDLLQIGQIAGIGQRVKHDDFVLRILIHPVLHEISTNKPGATGYE